MKPVSVLLFAIAAAFVSCSKEEIPQEVKIQYQLTDDVSPVKVKLKVEGNFHWAEWKYNDTDNYYPDSDKGISEYVFQPQEIAVVNFSGSTSTDEKCSGRLALQIPPVASKVEFLAISAPNLSGYFPVTLGKYKLEFFLHDPYPKVSQSVIVEVKNIQADRLDFPTPVRFDIPHFYENTEHFVSLIISKVDEPTPVFSYNIYLKEKYLFDRIYFGRIQIGFNEPALFLEADWKP